MGGLFGDCLFIIAGGMA